MDYQFSLINFFSEFLVRLLNFMGSSFFLFNLRFFFAVAFHENFGLSLCCQLPPDRMVVLTSCNLRKSVKPIYLLLGLIWCGQISFLPKEQQCCSPTFVCSSCHSSLSCLLFLNVSCFMTRLFWEFLVSLLNFMGSSLFFLFNLQFFYGYISWKFWSISVLLAAT